MTTLPIDTAKYTFSWDFSKVDYAPQIGSYQQVITHVYWTLWGYDDQGNSVPAYGNTAIDTGWFERGGSDEDWIPFEEMQKPHVEDLVEATIGPEELLAIKQNLVAQLKQFINRPAIVSATPPWVG
jgi:hypothetical protein